MDSDARLPLFPLGVVLYPGEAITLHIFEYRYREMVRLCLDERRAFGIVLVNEAELANVGCTARIEKVMKTYDDGRLDIQCRGEQRFLIGQVYRDKPYLTAEVTAYDPTGRQVQAADRATKERVITQHMKLLEMAGETLRPSLYETDGPISFLVARNAGLDLAQKQTLLEMKTERERLVYLTQHFETLLRRVELAREVRRRSQGDGFAGDLPALE